MNITCPKCGAPSVDEGRCILCGARLKSCTFHKWHNESESMRVCKKCGRTQTRGLTYDWTNNP